MTNNQEWFNREHHKESKKIRLTEEGFQGELIIENYLQLEKLYLRDIKNISRVVLKNLPQLQEYTI